MQYYLGIADPGSLTDEEWATKFEVLQFIRTEELKASLTGKTKK